MKTRLTGRLGIMLIVGAFVVAMAVIGAKYFEQIRQRNQLAEELAITQRQIEGINIDELIKQENKTKADLDSYTESINKAKTELTTPLIVSVVFRDVLAIANRSGVNVTVIGSSAKSDVDVSGVSYSSLSLNLALEGNQQNIYDFVSSVTQDVSTGVLAGFNVSVASNRSNSNMRLTIFSY